MLVKVTPRSGARAAIDALREHGDTWRSSEPLLLSRVPPPRERAVVEVVSVQQAGECVYLLLEALCAR